MASSLNKAMLIGNIGRDPETRYTTNKNLAVSTFSVATTYSIKNADGEWKNETTWHNIVAFSLSDYVRNVLKKGSKVYVEGRIQKREYVDKAGQKREVFELIAERVLPLDGRVDKVGGDEGASYSPESAMPLRSIDEAAPAQTESETDLPF